MTAVQPEPAPARIAVLLLEPDPWRFRGMTVVMEDSGDLKVIGDRDFARILTSDQQPEELQPDVCVVAHRLVVEYGIGIIPHLKDIFRGVAVLVHGDHESVHTSAEILAVGASGFFTLDSPPGYLPRAVSVVSQGRMWGPREAVALMAQRVIEREDQSPQKGGYSADDLMLLRYLHDGLSNKEIALRLHIAEVTVKARLGRLYRKFGVNTRLQLLSAAIRAGLVV
jgi:two-component system, NarL family, response regulator DevR